MHRDQVIRRRGGGGALLAVAALFLAGCGTTVSTTFTQLESTAAPSGATPSASAASASSAASPDARQPLLVDTDVAADDIVAITFLLRSPLVSVKAITVSGTGEAHCAGGVDVVLRLLDRLQAAQIPVTCGHETTFAGGAAFPDAWRAATSRGSGLSLPPTSRQQFIGSAVELIRQTAATAQGRLRILTLGPMTNVADAFAADSTLADSIESLYAMGGAIHVPGNVRNGGPVWAIAEEWNVFVDPHAAQLVIESGIHPHFIGLDGTNQVPVTTDYAHSLEQAATTPAGTLVAELLAANPFMTDGSYYLWDPLAAEAAAGYPIGTFTPARVYIEEVMQFSVGTMKTEGGAPNIDYLSTADPSAAERTLLETLN